MVGGMHGRVGHAWGEGGMHGGGACMAGGHMPGEHTWWGACVAGGACMADTMRYGQ